MTEVIPEAAVEAAAQVIREKSLHSNYYPTHDAIVAVLEAAAPHLQGRAWEEGYGLGYSDHVWSKGHEPRERNPYRTAK